MNGHALLSPSSAYRWMTCAGSVAMCKGLPDEASEYADEGTAMHTLASMCLTENRDALAYLNRRIQVGHRTFEMTEDRCADVQVYVDNVRQYAQGHTLLVEQALPISHITGEAKAEGTGDAIIVTADGEELQLHDAKFGRGVLVSARENKQLQLYALGALELVSLLGYAPKRFRLVIHQPRINTAPDEWDCTAEELQRFAEHAKARAFHAMQVYKGEHPDAVVHHLKPSDEACKFCRAKPTCPALSKFVEQSIGTEFENIAAINTQLAISDDTDLATKMKACDLVEDWLRAVRAEVERRLLAAIPVPGFKLVQGRQGNRAWTDEAAAEEMLRKRFRLPMEEAYSMKVISPTQAEKVLKEKPKQWATLQALITRAEGKLSVAPESDKRPAHSVKPAADDFAVVSEAADLV